MKTSEDRIRILIAVTESSPVGRLWRAALELSGGDTEVVALFVSDDRWRRAASLPFTREISKLGGSDVDFTRQRAEELYRETVARIHRRIEQLAAEADLALAFEELSEQDDTRLQELAAGARSIVIAPTIIRRQPIYASLSRLDCRIELIETTSEDDGNG